MSLLCWLPLVNGYENCGSSTATFSYINNNSALSQATTGGKFGKCYVRTASAKADLLRSSQTFNLNGDITMMCWAYVQATIGDTANGLISSHSHADNTGVGITVKQVSTTDYRISCSTGTGSSRTFFSYYGTSNIKDKWCHLALTYDKTSKVLKLWVNGVVEYTLNNYTNGSKADYFDLFNWSTTHYTNADYRPTCKLNDVRLYDECVSPKIIKEAAKGLVIHYKMNDRIIQVSNLRKNYSFGVYNNYSGSGTTGSVAATGEYYLGAPVYRLTMTPNDSSVSNFRSALYSHGVTCASYTFAANTKYCFWLYYRPVTHADIRVGGTASNISGWTEIAPKEYRDGWYVVGQSRNGSVTENKTDTIFTSFYTPTAASGVAIKIDFCCPHLIQGYDTIQDDGDYQDLIDYTKEIDCSGNRYNGTRAGTWTYADGGPRYSRSMVPTTTSTHIVTPAIDMTGFTNSFTVTWWSKIADMSGKMAWGFSNGNRLNLYPATYFCCNTGDGANNPFKNNGTSISFSGYNGGWHFYALTGNGSTNILYIDGVERGRSTTYKGITGTQIYISGWSTETNYKWTNGNLVDWRLYSTALSAADILDMYNSPIKLTKAGKLLCGEISEV